MADASNTETESNTAQVCGVCGYVLHDCVQHPGVHPSVLRSTVRTVPRRGEEHTRALSSFHANKAHYEKREKESRAY